MEDDQNSPPTSPAVCPSPLSSRSPPTSPCPAGRSPASSIKSPETSVSSDEGPSVHIGRKRKTPSRTTFQRRLQRMRHMEDDSSDESEINEDNNQEMNQQSQEENHVDDYSVHVNNLIVEFNEVHNVIGGNNSPAGEGGMRGDTEEDSSASSGGSDSDSDSSLSSSTSEMSSPTSEAISSDSDCSDSSDTTAEELYEGAAMSANEGLLKVLKLYVNQGSTKKNLDETIKLIKKLLPQPNEMPTSAKAALKVLEDMTPSFSESEFVYCKTCLQLVEEETELCRHTEGHGKFYSLPIGEQIRHMFEQTDLASRIDSYREHSSIVQGLICDIVSGSEYRKYKNQLQGLYDLVLLWNSDGLALSSSSNQEMWLILCTICEVPPRLRAGFVVVAGVYVGKKAPNMNVFLKPFSSTLQHLYEEGISWNHPLTKEKIVSKIVAPVVCADAPAKAKILNCKNHNGRYGCLICEQKSEKLQRPPEVVNEPRQKKKKRLRRFVYQDDVEPAEVRTGDRMNLQGALAKVRGKSRKGVMGDSVISDIPFLDRAACIAAEYMHLILLGVVKYLLLRIFTKSGQWYLGNKIDEINEFIMKEIKVPDYITRIPRPLKDLKYWKASELRNFLLFYSLPIFKKFGFPDAYYQHWILLVGAVHILLKSGISDDDLKAAEIMIRSFVRSIGTLYGEECYTYNVHNLLHLCLLVKRWGPLWATSAFVFETFNGYVSAHIHGTKNLAKELVNTIKIFQRVVVLENIVNSGKAGNRISLCSDVEVLGKPWNKQLKEEEQSVINLCDLGIYRLFIRVKLHSKIYTSKLYDVNKKRANSFIQFTVPNQTRFQYGQIIVFLKTQNGTLHCLVSVFKISQVNLLFHEQSRRIISNLRPIEPTHNLAVMPLTSIVDKVQKIGNYVGIRPNSYEVNL